MGKFRFIAVLAFAALMTASCYNDIESQLAVLERRVSNIDQKLSTINNNISALSTLAEKYKSYVYVLSYRPIYSGKDIAGYNIELSDGTTVTLMNGVSKDDPLIGLQLDEEDGLYYWVVTVNGVTDFFYDEAGQKIAASVASPIMKIVDDVWKVSFDNGFVWQTFDRARAEDGRSFIDSIITRGDWVNIYLVSGQTVRVPTYSLYENYFNQLNNLNANMDALRAIYEAKKANTFIQTVVPIVESGETVGYNMVFSDSTSIEVHDGKRYEGQDIGLAQYTDGEYYWAVTENGTTRWMYNDLGDMVQASPIEGHSPVFMLEAGGDGKYYWCYKFSDTGMKFYLYDENGNKVAASSSGLVQVFSSVTVTDSYVLFTPLSGEPFYVPRYKSFTIFVNSTTVTIPEGHSVSVAYRVSDVSSAVAITVITEAGYHASLTKNYNAENQQLSGSITFTADAGDLPASTALVLVSDGEGHMQTIRINVVKQ